MGPTLFNLYVADIPNSSKSIFQYADDTALVISEANFTNLSKTLQSEMDLLNNWFINNRLLLSPSKCELVVFNPNSTKNTPPIKIKISGNEIVSSESARYLGIFFDKNLNWHLQISKICSKCSFHIRLLASLKHCLSKKQLRNIYYPLIQSHFDHGDQTWSTALSSDLNRLDRLQKRVCKIILGIPRSKHIPSSEILSILQINSLSDRRNLRLTE